MEVSPIAEIVNDYEEIRLSPLKDFSRMDEIVFWAYDDTVEPGKVYKYRIRLGVLNPVAGTNQLAAKDAPLKNKAIIWSDFSAETEPMDIPARLYFFPTLYQEMAELVKVDVAKFEQGYWYNETFDVRPGESVGREVEVKDEDETDARVNSGLSPEAQIYARGGRGGIPSFNTLAQQK